MNIEMTNAQAKLARDKVEGEMHALKNHIVSAVECGGNQYGSTGLSGFEYAVTLTVKLRVVLDVFKVLNGAIMRDEGVI